MTDDHTPSTTTLNRNGAHAVKACCNLGIVFIHTFIDKNTEKNKQLKSKNSRLYHIEAHGYVVMY